MKYKECNIANNEYHAINDSLILHGTFMFMEMSVFLRKTLLEPNIVQTLC